MSLQDLPPPSRSSTPPSISRSSVERSRSPTTRSISPANWLMGSVSRSRTPQSNSRVELGNGSDHFAGTWESPIGAKAQFITVSSTSPGRPVAHKKNKNQPEPNPLSPATNSLLSALEFDTVRYSNSKSPPLAPPSPHTPSRYRNASISSYETHSPSPGSTLGRSSSVRPHHTPAHNTSRDDLADDTSINEIQQDPRSILTEEAHVVSQPSLANMMEMLEQGPTPMPLPESPGLPVLRTEPNRPVAPLPVWVAGRNGLFNPPESPSPPPHGSRQGSPVKDDAFLVTSWGTFGNSSRSRVSYPLHARSMGSDESAGSVEDSLHEAGILNGLDDVSLGSPLSKDSSTKLESSAEKTPSSESPGSPELSKESESVRSQDSVSFPRQEGSPIQQKEKKSVQLDENELGPTADFAKREDGLVSILKKTLEPTPFRLVQHEEVVPKPVNSCKEAEAGEQAVSASASCTNDRALTLSSGTTSLPRILRPRLRVNFAWDDMSIPSAITFTPIQVSTMAPTPSYSVVSERAPAPPRRRVSSLNWAAGMAAGIAYRTAYDGATGLASYGMSYVPERLRPKQTRGHSYSGSTRSRR